MSAAAAKALEIEFDRLAREGRQIGFWWRDDDAVAAASALDRLLAITGGAEIPLSLAVIPDQAQRSLAERISGEDGVTILVHGWRHANHAAPHERKAEFGPHRPVRELADDAANGLASIERRFGARTLPVFVPPWNRISPELAAHLPAIGYRALSCFGEARAATDIARLDTHLDPIDWRGTRSLAEPEALVAMIRRALSRGAEVIGLLTHHLVLDERLWSFCERMSALAASHAAIRPVGLAEIVATGANVRDTRP